VIVLSEIAHAIAQTGIEDNSFHDENLLSKQNQFIFVHSKRRVIARLILGNYSIKPQKVNKKSPF
jgi:hypothetical protein